MNKKTFKAAFPHTLPVMAGYLFLGAAFGILLQSKGYSPWWALLMSVFIYAGSMQFLAVNLLAGGVSLIHAALMTLMVNARHLFYGLSMLDKYKDTGKLKPYLIFSLTDETYSLTATVPVPEGVSKKWFYFLISFLDQIYWIIGSILGAVLGSLITFDTGGIDFVMTALFVTIYVDQWLNTKDHRPALVGILVSLICLIFLGADHFIIPAMIGITVVLSIMKTS
ncbi:MAG TPA: AzlC family ABC transporter permease, partial [Candidatus Merdenecus merdavium]|nr:AzlC family ABC transporter permease [Candidatus Merdenecus merdavium]